MTGEEARERVAAAFHDEGGCLEGEPWNTAGPNHRARFLKATEAALKTLGLDWTQAAALMSGEATVMNRRADPPGTYQTTLTSPASEKEQGRVVTPATIDELEVILNSGEPSNITILPDGRIVPASEKETP